MAVLGYQAFSVGGSKLWLHLYIYIYLSIYP